MEDRVVGRDGELAVLDRWLARVPEGPVGLVIAGEAGIGKTVLWKAAAEASARLCYEVLAARPAEAEASLPFAALADLLEGVADEVLPGLPEPQRHALGVALVGATDSGGQPVDQRTLSVAALGALRALARQRPVVVAVDDVQWLDASSARVLQFVARRLGCSPVGFLCSMRTSPDNVEAADLGRALPQGQLSRLTVGPLGVGALRRRHCWPIEHGCLSFSSRPGSITPPAATPFTPSSWLE